MHNFYFKFVELIKSKEDCVISIGKKWNLLKKNWFYLNEQI